MPIKPNNPSGGDKIETPPSKDEKAEQPAQPSPSEPEQVTLTIEELEAYFGFDKKLDISHAIKLTQTLGAERKVGDKSIIISDVSTSDHNFDKGSFTLTIKQGSINGQPIVKTFSCTGFAPRQLDAYQLGINAYASLKVMTPEEREYFYKNFDFESLYIDNNPNAEAYKPEQLKAFVDFRSSYFSSGTEGQDRIPHTFTNEELKELRLVDLSYQPSSSGGALRFKLSYKGKVSRSFSSIPFNVNEYYRRKITINKDFVRRHYMRGMKDNLLYFSGQFLEYDKDRYAAELVVLDDKTVVHANNADNKLTFDITFNLQRPNKHLASMQIEVDGFKPLKELEQDLVIVPTYKLIEDMRARLARFKSASIKERIERSVSNWIKDAEFYLKVNDERVLLEWEHNVSVNNSSISVLKGGFGHATKNYGLDIYLEGPRFEVRSAEAQGRDVIVKVEMTNTLEANVGAVFTLRLPGVL